ncbi:MAG: ABC transporter substrate-binding protein [Patescibacteria group bacterium]
MPPQLQPDQTPEPAGQSPLPNDANLPPLPVQTDRKTRFTPKRLLLGVTAAMLLAAIGWGIFQAATDPSTESKPGQFYQGKIRIGVTSWPGYLGLYIADYKGFFKDTGLDVELKYYDSLAETERDYLAGKLEGRANLTLDALKEAQNKFNHKIILAIDHSFGSDGIIAVPQIKAVAQFKGQKVAFEKNTLEEFFLRFALEQNGLTLADITPVDLDPEKSAQAFADGQVPIAVTYEPYMGKALSQRTGSVVFSSKDAPGLITDILTMPTDFIEKYPDSVDRLIRGYFRGLQFWKDRPGEGNTIMAQISNDTAENIAKQLEGITMLDERDNRIVFSFAAGLDSLYGNLRQLADFTSTGSQPSSGQFDTDQLIEPRFIEALSR